MGSEIEAIIASPPNRDELVVQLFIRDGGQWGEVFRQGSSYLVEIFTDGPLQLDAEAMCEAISTAITELKARLE